MNERFTPKESVILGIILVLFLAFMFTFVFMTQVLLWDEPVYLSNAYFHIDKNYFQEDFRFPLLEYVIAGFWFFTGVSVFSAQLLMIAISVLTLFVYYLLSRRVLSNLFLRGLSLTFLAFSPVFLYWGFRIYTDVLSLLFLLLSLYFFFEYYDRTKKGVGWRADVLLFLSGLCTALAFLAKFPAAISSLLIVPYLLYQKRFRDFVFYGLGNFLVLSPWMLYNFFTYGNPVWDLFAQAKVIASYTTFQPISLLFSFLLKNLGASVFFFLFFLFFYVRDKKLRKSMGTSFMLVIALLSLLYYSFGVGLKLQRYQLMIFPFFLLLSFVGIEKTLLYLSPKKKILFLTLVFTLSAFSLFSSLSENTKFVSENYFSLENSSLAQSIEYAKTIPEGTVIISNTWTWYGYYGNHRARSVWDKNISLVLHDDKEAYLFITDYDKGLVPENLTFTGTHIQTFSDSRNTTVQVFHVYK